MISVRFYHEAESKCSNLVKRMLKLFIFAETFLFVPPMMIPIIYAAFDMPNPESWVLPLDIKYFIFWNLLQF